MSEVQKYELDCTMEPSDTGAWVEYGKYRDLEIERESRDREIAELRADPYAWYESAQRVNAELRERAEKAEAALDDIVTAWELPGAHCELIDAIEAALELLPKGEV